MTPSSPATTPGARLVRAGLACGVVDALWAVALTLLYHGSILRTWQGVAAVPFGAGMRDGGVATAALGLCVHFGVAFTWSALFVALFQSSAGLRRLVERPSGALLAAAVYGPLIWMVMSAVVIPLATHAALTITYRWWVQLAGHVAFVGAPIVWGARGSET